jgi:elongation factor G
MIEKIAETDDELTVRYLEGEPLTVEELKAALRRATLESKLVPVLCGAALKNKGVQPMLDAVVEYLPSPVDKPPFVGVHPTTGERIERRPSDDEPFSALCFKIVTDPYVGRLAYFRVYSGHLSAGSQVLNSTKGQRERIGRLLQMHANSREEIPEIWAGDICATIGLKSTFTGDTLCDSDHPILLETIRFPEPVIDVAVEPKTRADQDKLSNALARLAEEDPTFRVRVDPETSQTIISGMGELHLDVLLDRMVREYKVEANVGRPQVAYRERITQPADAEGRFVRQTGGRGKFGHCVLRVEPNEPGKGFEFVDAIVGGAIPREFIGAVQDGVRKALETGVIAGFPVVDIKVTLYDGSYHEVDSDALSFEIAGSMAVKEAVRKGKPVLLEPIFKVEVTTPDEFTGDVIGDLNRRRGHIQGMEPRGNATTVRALVPLSTMFGYATDIRSMTQGRATYSMEFDHYAEAPKSIGEEIMAKARA